MYVHHLLQPNYQSIVEEFRLSCKEYLDMFQSLRALREDCIQSERDNIHTISIIDNTLRLH